MPSQPAKQPVALRRPTDVARTEIRERIKKGRELQSTQSSTSAEIEAFQVAFKKWNDYNETLLTTLFTTDEEMMTYRWSVGGLVIRSESAHDRHRRFVRQVTGLSNALESILEKLDLYPVVAEDAHTTRSAAEPLEHIWSLIHEKVGAVAKTRFDNGQYADAVEASLKALNNEVKTIAKARGAGEMDGPALMHTVFSPKSPLIVLGDLSTQSGKDMQQGYMELFAGAISAVRNPKAHDNVTITPERALHFLFLASMLWHTLDQRL